MIVLDQITFPKYMHGVYITLVKMRLEEIICKS